MFRQPMLHRLQRQVSFTECHVLRCHRVTACVAGESRATGPDRHGCTPGRSRERRSPGHMEATRAVTGLAAAKSQRGRRRSHGHEAAASAELAMRVLRRSARLRHVGPS
jgi:hypothetical protein